MYSETYQVTVADLGNYEKEKQIEILVNDHGDHFELKTVVDTVEFEAQADDMFSAFQLLRDKMLEMAWGIKCNAARINAVQSGMMTNQDVVYLVELGKQARNEDVHDFWDYCEMEEHVYTEEQEVIIYKGLLEKFRQNENLKNALLDTGSNTLAECAVNDRIWGVGLSMTDDCRNDIYAWKGQNLLGYSLMLVRDELRNQAKW